MITIESSEDEIRVSIPRHEMDPVRLEQLLRLLQLEAAVSNSRMTDAEGEEMAEEMKAAWWTNNEHRFFQDPTTDPT